MKRISFIAKNKDIEYLNILLKYMYQDNWEDMTISHVIRYCIRYTYKNLIESNKMDNT